MINITRLRRRIAKYLDEHAGGVHQSGETKLSKDAGCGINAVRHLRDGKDVRESTLERLDNYLTAEGY